MTAAVTAEAREVVDQAKAPRQRMVLESGLTAPRLDVALQQACRSFDVSRRALAFYLEEMQRRALHGALGFSSAVHYAKARLGLERGVAKQLLAAGRSLRELPLIDRAFAEARISWTAVREILRVAEPETEAAWLEEALKLTTAELARKVSQSGKGRLPRESGALGLPEPKFVIGGKVTSLEFALFEQAQQRLELELGEELNEGAALVELVRRFLDSPPSENAMDKVKPSDFQVVVQRCGDCHKAELVTRDGPIELTDDEAAFAACDAPILHPGDDHHPQQRDGLTDSQRRRVLTRDHHRCRVCGSRRGLMVHHIHFREFGGTDDPSNLMTTCAACHGRIHAGLLFVQGKAPHDLEVRDRKGQLLEQPYAPPKGVVLEVELPAPSATGKDGEIAVSSVPPRPSMVTINDLPGTADRAWWGSHRHLFTWNDRKGALELEPGHPKIATTAEGAVVATSKAPRSTASGGMTLDQVIGQEHAVQVLKTAVEAARLEDRSLPAVLLFGPAGLGKTTLCQAAAASMGTTFRVTSGPLLKTPAALIPLLTSLPEKGILFVDEIHAMPRPVVEVLYEVMEKGTLSLPVVCGTEATTLTDAGALKVTHRTL